MKVQCEKCGVKLNLPDDKLEPGMDFSFNCPKCNQKNTIKVPGKEEAEAPAPAAAAPAGDFEEDEISGGEEFYEEGAKPALICFDEGTQRKNLVEIMKNMGYVPVLPSSTRDALKRMQVTRYNVILIHENYDGQTVERNALLRLLQPMEMTSRRRIFVALFGNGFKTFDYMAAYALSVNTVINTADEPKYPKILERAFAEYRRFYKVFFEVMSEMGKI
ncbi:MAG: hypothetical protein AB1896_04340 [Thermodesulfobacteriota bacterium]